jgi:hypothetical protein
MTEPTEEEMDRAERIRRLRTGGARSRGHQMREHRREAAEEEAAEGGAAEEEATDTETDGDDAAASVEGGATDGGAAVEDAARGALSATGDADVLEMASRLPEDGSLFVVPADDDLRRKFDTVAEQLHLRYGFQFESELDEEQHLRPLALYLGIKTLDDADVEVVKELLESVDELEAPDEDGA